MTDGKIDSHERNSAKRADGFANPILFGVTVATVFFTAFLILYFAGRILLLTFGGVLLAIFLHKTTERLSQITHLSRNWSLAIVILALFSVIAALTWLFGPHLISQLTELRLKIPSAVDKLKNFIEQFSWGSGLMNLLPSPEEWLSANLGSFSKYMSDMASLGFAILIILFVGIYSAVSPEGYFNGLVSLVPVSKRARVSEVLKKLGDTLQWWLVGRLLDMILVGILTGIGLWLLNVPLALTLAVLAGALVFIPVIGPLISAIPAILVAFAHEPVQALYVAMLYTGIQQVESYLILPPVQRYMISMPPVLTIVVQAVMYMLAGIIGLLFAAPLAAAARLLVQMLYVHDYLEKNP